VINNQPVHRESKLGRASRFFRTTNAREDTMIETVETVERLEQLAAWHRINAEHAGSAWVWEARLRTAEDLERRAASLRKQQRRGEIARPIRSAA
jgi:hypothetical protein